MSRKPKSELTPAVGYLRKSTKGERADGRERQEKSISQQRAESAKLANGRFEIVKWFEDEGISGWKRGAKRPDFQRMLNEVKSLGAQAIICDNIDRFSRATVDEVQIDASELRSAGVRWIVTASHGTYDLGKRHDIGEILKFVVAVWSANEYSRQLSRRVSLARRNAAVQGKRTCGPPYAMAKDGKGGLKSGDAKQVRVVQQVFDLFADQLWSMNRIVGDLNARKIPSPKGRQWSVKSLAQLIRRRVYRGDFTYNVHGHGHFYRVDASGEVVETAEGNGTGKLFVVEGCYKPIVPPELFDKAQRRLATLTQSRSRRRMSYALSGILVCDHCGRPMFGSRPAGRPTHYGCSTPASQGRGSCQHYTIRESQILPLVMRLLGEEVQNIQTMLTAPPDDLRRPNRARKAHREQTQKDRDALAKRIARADEVLMLSDDERTRKSLDARVSAMRDELEQLDAKLALVEPVIGNGYTKEDLAALTAWWDDFQTRAVSVPVKGELPVEAWFHLDPESFDEPALLLDHRVVNHALHQLGAKVRLRWRTETYKTSNGVSRQRHVLVRGRFQLGQRKGKLPVIGITSGPPESPWRAVPESSSVSGPLVPTV